MPIKGMRTVFFKPSPSSSPARSPSPFSPVRHTFSDTLVEETVANAESVLTKWDSDPSGHPHITCLFRENPHEAKRYLNCVKDLHSTMLHLFSVEASSPNTIIRAHNLLQSAMNRLAREFHQMLSSHRDIYTNSDSVSRRSSGASTPSSFSDLTYHSESEDELNFYAKSAVPEDDRALTNVEADLKAIADCMIGAGHGKECISIYKMVRKSVVEEELYHLGFERPLSSSQIQKMDWDILEVKIKSWLGAVKAAVTRLFHGERILCDRVFSASPSIRDSCFSGVTKDSAVLLFEFAESVARCKRSPEKIFRLLDVYEAIANLWLEIESIFSSDSALTVQSQAINSLVKLGNAIRTTLADFEMAIQKESSKSAVPGGGIHPLTRYVMNYLTFLADYSQVLGDILADWPLDLQSSLPESYFIECNSEESFSSPMSRRFAWLVLVLLCKLDVKAERYKDVALAYIFLANNLNYVVGKVLQSDLRYLLGDVWIIKHESKVRQYASNYERIGWSNVFASLLPENPTAAEISPSQAKETFRKFNAAMEDVGKKQGSWVVPDPKLRDEIKSSLSKKLVPAYRQVYDESARSLRGMVLGESVVKYAPEDLVNHLSEMLQGGAARSVSSSSYSSRSSSYSYSPSPVHPIKGSPSPVHPTEGR